MNDHSPTLASGEMVEVLTLVRHAIHENRLRWMTNDSPKACREMHQAEIDVDKIISALSTLAASEAEAVSEDTKLLEQDAARYRWLCANKFERR